MQQRRRLWTGIQALALCAGSLLALSAAPLAAQSHHFVYLSAAAAHTVSGFELNPASGGLTPISQPPFNEGLDHHAIALHPSGKFLYVINEGEKSVSGFEIHPTTGALTKVPASPFSVQSGAAPKLIVAERSGRFVYVATASDLQQSIPSSLSIYAVTEATGALVRLDTFSLGLFAPAGLVAHPTENFLYLVGTLNSNVWIYTFQIDLTTGNLSGGGQGGVGEDARSVAIDPKGRFLFLGHGRISGLVETYLISPGGVLSPASRFDTGVSQAFPYAVAAEATGSYLYGAFAGRGLRGFSINQTTGELTDLSGPPFVAPPVSPTTVLVADTAAPFLYYNELGFQIPATGVLALRSLPLVIGPVTGIAAANPLDAVQPASAPVAALAPLSLQFSEQYVGSFSPQRQISLSNPGNAPLILTGISLTGINASEFALSYDCLAVLPVLPASNGCTITITFQPSSEGPHQAALSVVDNAPGSPHSVTLAGAGLLPFTIEPDSPTNASVTAGQIAQYNLRLVPALGFVGQVSLACSGAPDQAACDLPPSIDLNGVAPVPFSVRVPTKARSALAPVARRFYPVLANERFRKVLAWAAVLTLLLLLFPGSRTAPVAGSLGGIRIHCAVVLLLVCVSLGMVSCSGATGTSNSTAAATSTGTSSTSPSPAPSPAAGTPAGQYALTLTAASASGGAPQVLQLSLSVQ